eukprot:TRINITY_DN221_c0_g1_i1.p1 TRINITY_DN221_c0_g1~~TRINITY_DN221_c0_g1_i1.p1  ORF type:complete len:414 (+),score=132.29 TRINITY_DN221_c0_g1_i1:137-1378(+)
MGIVKKSSVLLIGLFFLLTLSNLTCGRRTEVSEDETVSRSSDSAETREGEREGSQFLEHNDRDGDRRTKSNTSANKENEPHETVQDVPDTVDDRCPSISKVAKRRQGIFRHLIRRWRKAIETQQPWDQWSRKIIKCSLGKQLYTALGPESKIHMTENIRAILTRELKLRQSELAQQERKKNPCHPFLAERGKLKAILKFRASMVLARKPIVYLYPETTMDVNVTVSITDGDFTTLYPKFHHHPDNVTGTWHVRAQPDGTLTHAKCGRTYNYLFWEAKRTSSLSFSPSLLRGGRCVEREKVEKYLESSLTLLGLNQKERNDFIVYWLPELEKNQLNVISFATEEYNAWSTLSVSPPPKSLLRIFMTFSPLKEDEKSKEICSALSASSFSLPSAPQPRVGFTVVEWGGAEVPLAN